MDYYKEHHSAQENIEYNLLSPFSDILPVMQGLTVVALAALALSSLAVLVSRFLRLRHIPGPRLAAVTDLWAATKTWRGERYHNFIRDLHIQYGPVVRWGPNRVSFSQPEAIPAIYGTKDVFPKASLVLKATEALDR